MKIRLFFMFSLSTRSMTPNYLGTLIFMRKSCLPIGFIRSALKCRDGAPLQGLEGAPDALEMLPAYLEGLIVCNAATKSLSSPGFIALAGTCQSPCVQNGPPARSGVAHFVPFFATCGTIGVGTTTQVAPPSEPGRPISGTRLSSWWLLQRRSASHSMRLF